MGSAKRRLSNEGDERPVEVAAPAAAVRNCRLDSNMRVLSWIGGAQQILANGGGRSFRSGRVLPRADRAGRMTDQGGAVESLVFPTTHGG